MTLSLYMDHHGPSAVTAGLRLRGIDVLTAFEDRGHRLPDPTLPDRATGLGRVLVSQDKDFLAEAALRQRAGRTFAGLIFAPQIKTSIGKAVRDIEFICGMHEPDEMRNEVIYIPL